MQARPRVGARARVGARVRLGSPASPVFLTLTLTLTLTLSRPREDYTLTFPNGTFLEYVPDPAVPGALWGTNSEENRAENMARSRAHFSAMAQAANPNPSPNPNPNPNPNPKP